LIVLVACGQFSNYTVVRLAWLVLALVVQLNVIMIVSRQRKQFGKFFCMAQEVPLGIRGEAEETVEHRHTLSYHNASLPPIYSTPNMIGLMEWAAANSMLPFLGEGEISVGTAINIEHRGPTTIGARVKAEAVLGVNQWKVLYFSRDGAQWPGRNWPWHRDAGHRKPG